MPHLQANRNDRSMCDRLLVMWTKEEDAILRDQVKLHGIDKWAKIATQLCGKTSRQCRRRWHMFLNVVNKRGGWSADEDKLLLEAHRKFGNRWTEIAKKLPGRTDNAVKNRFCVLCKKQTKEAEITPSQRCMDSRSEDGKQQLRERRFLEGPKGTNGAGGVNKKMRREPSPHNRTKEVVKQRPLEETLQQWKGVHSSDVSANSPHQHSSLERSLQPWESFQSNMLIKQGNHDDRFNGWKQLAREGPCHPQTPLQGNLQQWEGSQSRVEVHDSICSERSLQGEPESLKVLQSQIQSMSPSSHPGLIHENLHQWKRVQSGDGTSDCKHQYSALKKRHPKWCGVCTTDCSNNKSSKQQPVSELVQWWKESDVKSMTSDPILQQGEVDEALHHWEHSLASIDGSLNHQRSVDENLPPLSEISSLAMGFTKQSTSAIAMQRWLTTQSGKFNGDPQQLNTDGMTTWDTSKEKQDDGSPCKLKSKNNAHQWQDWKSNEANTSHCQQRSQEYNLHIDEQKPGHSEVEEGSFQQALVNHMSLWTSKSCQESTPTTVKHMPDGHRAHLWQQSQSDAPANIQHHPLDNRLQQWDKDGDGGPGPVMSILNRFSGHSDSNAKPLSSRAELQQEHKSSLVEEPWKTAVEKSSFAPTSLTADAETRSPREVLDEDMSEGPKEDHLKTVTTFPSLPISPIQTSKAADSIWDLQANLKNPEDAEMHRVEEILSESVEEILSERNTSVEMRNELCTGHSDEVDLMNTEGQTSGVSTSPTPADGDHSPSQTVSRSHLPMECMPSPQFSDSEKEFLLSTLDQTNSNSWQTSPLRPPSRFSKIRNPLIDSRYDTPARSPLSSCLLRQFQVSEASRLA